MMLKTIDEELCDLQSVQAYWRDVTSKSSNDADVTQSHKPSHQHVSNSIRIGHFLLQQHIIGPR